MPNPDVDFDFSHTSLHILFAAALIMCSRWPSDFEHLKYLIIFFLGSMKWMGDCCNRFAIRWAYLSRPRAIEIKTISFQSNPIFHVARSSHLDPNPCFFFFFQFWGVAICQSHLQPSAPIKWFIIFEKLWRRKKSSWKKIANKSCRLTEATAACHVSSKVK